MGRIFIVCAVGARGIFGEYAQGPTESLKFSNGGGALEKRFRLASFMNVRGAEDAQEVMSWLTIRGVAWCGVNMRWSHEAVWKIGVGRKKQTNAYVLHKENQCSSGAEKRFFY